MVHISILNVMY